MYGVDIVWNTECMLEQYIQNSIWKAGILISVNSVTRHSWIRAVWNTFFPPSEWLLTGLYPKTLTAKCICKLRNNNITKNGADPQKQRALFGETSGTTIMTQK